MNKEIINEYVDLKIKVKDMEARLDELQPIILQDLVKEGEEAVIELEGKGNLTWYSKRTWKFPKPIMDAEEQVKKMKKEAQAKGHAEYTEEQVLKFNIKEPQ